MPDNRDPDQWISAYLDGMLDDAEMAEFEQALELDPKLAADFARMTQNDALLRSAFDLPLQQDVDAAMLARFGLADEKPVALAVAIPRAANDNPPFWRGWRLPAAGAIAAALVFAVTLGMPGDQLPMQFDPALDETATGQLAMLEDGAQLTPVLSFAAADGRFCREFSLAGGPGDSMSGGRGIACRGAGGWQVEALEPGARELADSSGIVLASGDGMSALDAAYARLGAGDPISLDREGDLIRSGWREKS